MQRSKVVPIRVIRSIFHKAFAEGWDGNAEGDVSVLQLSHEVRLFQSAVRWRVNAAGDRKQVMHAAVRCAISIVDETRFQHWPVRLQEWRDGVGRAVQIGNSNLWVLGRTASTDSRLRMAQQAAVAVECRSQASQRFAAE